MFSRDTGWRFSAPNRNITPGYPHPSSSNATTGGHRTADAPTKTRKILTTILLLITVFASVTLYLDDGDLDKILYSSGSRLIKDQRGLEVLVEADMELEHGSNNFATQAEMEIGSVSNLKKDHPSCFSDHLFTEKPPTSKSLNIYEIGKFTKIGRDVTSSVRYDYSCPSMKPRYNCAKNKKDADFEYGERATHWKLNLVPHQDDEDECNLWELTASMGGPIGLAKNLLAQKEDPQKNMIHVFMGGNSYLRQIFEALKCGFHEDITQEWVQRGANYGVSLAELAELGLNKIGLSKMGSMRSPPDASNGICAISGETDYYQTGVQPPIMCSYQNSTEDHEEGEGWDDNIGMVEFGGIIRFHYIFRPYIYEDVQAIFQSKFHLDSSQIDVLVFNDEQETVLEEKDPKLVNFFEKNGLWQSKIIWPYETFTEMQLRDTNIWFGADNPWITHPPDGHACMPGVPDDEVNLLLFLMLSGSVLE